MRLLVVLDGEYGSRELSDSLAGRRTRLSPRVDADVHPGDRAVTMQVVLRHIAEVRHLGGHRLWLRFRDGSSGEVDLAQTLRFHGVFEPLRDEDYFARVSVIEEAGTIGWPNDVDLDADVLHSLATGTPLPKLDGSDSIDSGGERSTRRVSEHDSDDSRVTALPHGSPSSCTEAPMPLICRFLGIEVRMQFNDHAPPHFHVRYGEFAASVGITPPIVLEGRVPPRVAGLVIEWATLHRAELLADWDLARQGKPLREIDPLE